jgi:hypothetical protein
LLRAGVIFVVRGLKRRVRSAGQPVAAVILWICNCP